MTRPNYLRCAAGIPALAVALALGAGCNKTIDDATLANNVHAALSGDSAIATEPIQPTVVAGVVTLNGSVSNDTARAVAARDAAGVKGVKQVVNALAIQGIAIAPEITAPEAPAAPRIATVQERKAIARHESLPPPPAYAPPQQAQYVPPPPQQQQPVQAVQAAPPPPPPAPIFRDVNVPAGTGISVRINQTLDSESTPEGAEFTGVVSNSVVVDGEVAIPAGSGVTGRVTTVHDAGHFKGNSLLTVEITGIRRKGERIDVASEPYSVEGKGRGKNTAEKVGGGAAVGAILGGILGGGKGAAIGAAAGGGAGAGVNAVTRGQQVQIQSESIVRFRLANGFTVRSAGRAEERGEEPRDGGLQQRQPQ